MNDQTTQAAVYTPDLNNIALQGAFLAGGMLEGDNLTAILDAWGNGHVELFSCLSAYAVVIDKLQHAMKVLGVEYPGVYEYEVTEDLGQMIGDHILREGSMPTNEACLSFLVGKSHKFFVRTDPVMDALMKLKEQELKS